MTINNARLRILILTQYYLPEIGAPQNRLSELARGLSEKHFKVYVLTGMPNYPTGKIYPGYKGLFKNEMIEGIQVYRSFIYPTKSTNIFKRLLSYFSFTLSSFFVGVFLPKSDFILTESPPIFLGLTGYCLSRIKKSKWIFNVADLWPSSVVELGIIKKNSLFFKISNRLESFFYRKATIVTGQSKTILNNIITRYPETLTYHLSNGVNPENYTSCESTTHKKIKIMYAGLLGLAQGLDQIIEAASVLQSNPNIEFVLIGDGPEKTNLINEVKSSGINNVSFFEPLPKSQIPKILASADIIIIPLKIQLTGAVPSKLYEGMAAGKPIILIAESEAAEIVRDSNSGIVVSPGDIKSLVLAILHLATHSDERLRLGENGQKVVRKYYDLRKIARDFADYLQIYTD